MGNTGHEDDENSNSQSLLLLLQQTAQRGVLLLYKKTCRRHHHRRWHWFLWSLLYCNYNCCTPVLVVLVISSTTMVGEKGERSEEERAPDAARCWLKQTEQEQVLFFVAPISWLFSVCSVVFIVLVFIFFCARQLIPS